MPFQLVVCRIEIASGLKSSEIGKAVYQVLGFCPVEQRVRPGLLAEATMPQIRAKLVQLLHVHGMEIADAEEVCSTLTMPTETRFAQIISIFLW